MEKEISPLVISSICSQVSGALSWRHVRNICWKVDYVYKNLQDHCIRSRLLTGQKGLSIKANMLWNSFGSLVNLGCQWLITVLIMRMTNGYEAAGVFSLAMSVYNIFAPIGQYRMYTYQITDVNNENTTGEYLAFRFITNGAAIMLCMGYTLLTCNPTAYLSIFLYAIYKSAMLVIDVFHACDQRHHRMDYIGKSLSMQGILSLLAFVITFALSSNLEFALLGMIIVIIIIGILYDIPRAKTFGAISFGISRDKTFQLLLRCLPIVIASMAASAAVSVPRQYLSIQFGEETLGIYAAAAAPVALIQIGASYIYNPLLSYFSERYGNRDKAGFFSLLNISFLIIVTLGVACSVAIAMLGEPLLLLVYGEKMRSYAYLLLPLVILALLTGFMWFINDLLMAIRNFRGVFIGNIISLIASLISLPLIKVYTMNGVTIVCFISILVGIITMSVILIIQLKLHW